MTEQTPDAPARCHERTLINVGCALDAGHDAPCVFDVSRTDAPGGERAQAEPESCFVGRLTNDPCTVGTVGCLVEHTPRPAEPEPPKAEQEIAVLCREEGAHLSCSTPTCACACHERNWPKADTGTLETAIREWVDATDARRALNETDEEAPIALLKPANKRVKAAESVLRALVIRSKNTPVFASKDGALIERMEQEISLQDRLDETSRIAVLLRDALTELRRLRAEIAINKHARALSLLGRSSEQEAREEGLREKLAEAEIRAEKAEARASLAYGSVCRACGDF